MRRFTLPTSVDAGAIKARTKDGVLEVTVSKAAEAQPRRITVEG
jgi:HSP20 family molecular chaperone IbpA